MNPTLKIYSVNKLLLFLSLGWAANPFDIWLDSHAEILMEEFKRVSFTISVKSNFDGSVLAEDLTGKIITGPGKQFYYEVGPRVVISDGEVWKSYDERTDQIFIQEIDKKLEKKIFSWVNLKKVKVLPVKKKKDGSYKLSIFSKHTDVRLHFGENNNLKYLTISEGDMETRISNIQLNKEDSLSLVIGSESSSVFDLR